MRWFSLLFVCCFSFCLGCRVGEPDRFSVIATAYCECTTPLVELNRQLDTAAHHRLPDYFRQMEVAYRQARECLAVVIGQYGVLPAAQLDTLQGLLQQRCPAIAQQRDLLEELLGQ